MGRRLIQRVHGGYSDTDPENGVICPHDLLWTVEQTAGDDVPDWARARVAQGGPFVVRRAPRRPGRLPVGVRGARRQERFAMTIDSATVTKTMTPEQCATRIGRASPERQRIIAALGALPSLAATLDSQNLCWGLTGAVGYELATAEAACHDASDIDVLLRLPQRLSRSAAREIAASLAALGPRCDLQMETPLGGVALADWAADNDEVLVKSDQGPFLCTNPWQDHRPSRCDSAAAGH